MRTVHIVSVPTPTGRPAIRLRRFPPSHDPVVMHDRMRTLSTRLMLTFDSSHVDNILTLPRMKDVRMKRMYSVDFDMSGPELEHHMDRVCRAAGIIEQCACLRLELYRELGGMQ